MFLFLFYNHFHLIGETDIMIHKVIKALCEMNRKKANYEMTIIEADLTSLWEG